MIKITLRIPDELHRDLCLIADDNERSLNSQIVYLLREAMKRLRYDASTNAEETKDHRARKL